METDTDSDERAATDEQAGPERNIWQNTTGTVESTIPTAIVDRLDLEAGDEVAIAPVVDDGAFALHVSTGTVDADRANVMRIKRRVEPFEQTTLRVPAALAAIVGLTDILDEDPSFEYEVVADGFLVRPWPPLRPWHPTGRGRIDLDREEKTLVPGESQYMLVLPTGYARVLDLERGQLVAWRLTIRDGGIAAIADFDLPGDVDATTEDVRRVRRAQSHAAGAEGRRIEQFHLNAPVTLVDALGWRDAPLALDVGEGYISVSRQSVTTA